MQSPLIPGWYLRIASSVMLLAHAVMCWMGQMPLRALLWDEELASGAVGTLAGMEWGEWVSSLQIDAAIGNVIVGQGWVFFIFALLIVSPLPRLALATVSAVASVNLVFLAWLKFHDRGSGIGHFFEHASQFLLPFLVTLILLGKPWKLVAKFALAGTFICHGASAIGITSQVPLWNHPRPGNYMEMTMQSLGIQSEAVAAGILLTAGILDWVVVVAIFLHGWPKKLGLAYMVVWGFLTALARPWFNFEPTSAADTLLRWLPEFLLRTPHFALPLCLLLALRQTSVKTPAQE